MGAIWVATTPSALEISVFINGPSSSWVWRYQTLRRHDDKLWRIVAYSRTVGVDSRGKGRLGRDKSPQMDTPLWARRGWKALGRVFSRCVAGGHWRRTDGGLWLRAYKCVGGRRAGAHRIRSVARCANTQTTPHAAIGGSDDSCGSKSTDGSIRSPHPLNCTGGFRTFQPPPLGGGGGDRDKTEMDNRQRQTSSHTICCAYGSTWPAEYNHNNLPAGLGLQWQ